MNPCLSAEDLDQVLAGTLPEASADSVRTHLLACEHCRQRLDELSEDSGIREWSAAKEKQRDTLPETQLNQLVDKLCAGSPEEVFGEHPAAAVTQQRQALASAPQVAIYRQGLTSHYGELAHVQRALGRREEALATLLELVQLWPAGKDPLFTAACEMAACLPPEAARSASEQTFAERCTGHVLQTLQQAVKHGFTNVAELERTPALAPVRRDPRYGALVEQLRKSRR